jgi:hypothetical protein
MININSRQGKSHKLRQAFKKRKPIPGMHLFCVSVLDLRSFPTPSPYLLELAVVF